MKIIYSNGQVAECPAEEELHVIRHTAAHIMAQAVKRLYPNTKLAIGPATDDGFYYDFDVEKPFSPDDLAALEDEIKKIAKEDIALVRRSVTPDEAREIMSARGETYKLELIDEHAAKGDDITLYEQGDLLICVQDLTLCPPVLLRL